MNRKAKALKQEWEAYWKRNSQFGCMMCPGDNIRMNLSLCAFRAGFAAGLKNSDAVIERDRLAAAQVLEVNRILDGKQELSQ